MAVKISGLYSHTGNSTVILKSKNYGNPRDLMPIKDCLDFKRGRVICPTGQTVIIVLIRRSVISPTTILNMSYQKCIHWIMYYQCGGPPKPELQPFISVESPRDVPYGYKNLQECMYSLPTISP
jgi:hypothetical protein